MKIILSLILIFVTASCRQVKPTSKKKILDFGAFTIEAPNAWSKVEKDGTDSYVGSIAIDSNDTVHFDLGWYSNTLCEYPPQIIRRSMLKAIQPIDTTHFVIVDHALDVDLDKYRLNNISWDTIDGYAAKVVFPIHSGKGTTGIYVDSLWQSGLVVDRFNLYGTDLKPENEKTVLQALRTLKFFKKSN